MQEQKKKVGVFSVDPAWASPAGWALWLPSVDSRAGSLRYGQIIPAKYRGPKDGRDAFRREHWKIDALYHMQQVRMKALELEVYRIIFLAETSFMYTNVKVSQVLSEARSIWECMAWTLNRNDWDFRFEMKDPVHPHQWQSDIIGKTGRQKGEKYREWLKDQARWIALGELSDHGVKVELKYDKHDNVDFPEHMADAICLNKWGRRIYLNA